MLVKKQFQKAVKETDLCNIRDLIGSILSFYTGDRPSMKHIFIALFELSFQNNFWLVKPTVDTIWQEKGNCILKLTHLANYSRKRCKADATEKLCIFLYF